MCAELENHLNIADKVLAEFIIDLARKSSDVDAFKVELGQLGAGLADSLVERLWNIIQHLQESTGLAARRSSKGQGRRCCSAPGGKYSGLAVENSKAHAKQLQEELVQEGFLDVAGGEPGSRKAQRTRAQTHTKR